jgi:flagellar hook-length control protein FliK
MDIIAMALCQAGPPEATAAKPAEASGGFAEVLETTQSGAPPGPEPPPIGVKVGEEGATLGQIALSQNPDFSPLANNLTTTVEEAAKPAKCDEDVDQFVAAMSATMTVGYMAPPKAAIDLAETVTSRKASNSIVTKAEAGSKPAPQLAVEVDALVVLAQGDAPPAPTQAISKPARPPSSSAKGANVVPDAGSDVKVEIQGETFTPSKSDLEKYTRKSDVFGPPSPPASKSDGKEKVVKQTPGSPAADVGPKSDESKGKAKATTKSSINADDSFLKLSDDTAEVTVEKVVSKDTSLDVELGRGSNRENAALKVDAAAIKLDTNAIDAKQPLARRDLNFVVKQISDRMELLAATKPRNGVTIQLQPAHLGSITMTIKSMGSSVEAEISASNDNVRLALEQNRSLLGQSMEQRGIKLESVSIAPQPQMTNSSHREAQQQPQQQQHANPHHTRQNSFSGTGTAPVHQARQTVRSVEGVDFWI